MATVAGRLAALIRDITGTNLPLRLRAWDGSEAGPRNAPVLHIRNRRALRRLLWAPGELGLARAYVTGDVDVDGDLADGLRRVWRTARSSESSGARLTTGATVKAVAAAARLGVIGPPPKPPAAEARLSGRLHTRRRDRAAIAHHYDLSNEFYRLLLDDHMAYSSAYFADPEQSLYDAQTAKLDLICRRLGLRAGMRLLDVGCGWGSLILYAAEHYGVHATGITLSAEERAFIADRVGQRGLAAEVEVRLQDYREFGELVDTGAEPGAFDAVSSVEMGEHVGEDQYPTYAAILFNALRPTGRLLLQQMSRRDDAAPGGGAFIERYVAPDMYMRPLWQTLRHLQNAGFEVREVEAMGEHYVRTVERWIDTFDADYDRFVAVAGEEVARVWRLYLVGGRLAFEEGRMGVDQVLAVRPRPPAS
jgi:cyclopropane-fatty-acyl-phospholipid synthase